MERDALVFRMLGDDNRLRMMVLLQDRQLCVGHIQDGLMLSQSNTSKQLTLLRNAGMVTLEKHKQRSYYSIPKTFLKDYPDIVALIKKLKQKVSYQEDETRMIAIHDCGCQDGCLCKL